MAEHVGTNDHVALQRAVNDASSRALTLWLSFVTFGTYLAITAGSVTHRALFLESPIKLPVLSVELPLVWFFAVAPLLLLIFHTYLFLDLLILGRKARAFNKALRAELEDAGRRTAIRRGLDSFVITQLLAGTVAEREGRTAFLLRTIAWLTLIIGPVVLLLLIQFAFLPYHGAGVTFVHRLAVAADLFIIWLFWSAIRSGQGEIRISSPRRHKAGVAVSTLVLLFSVFIATFPGELQDQNALAGLRWIPQRTGQTDKFRHNESGWRAFSLHELLFLGDVNDVTGRRTSLWSNTIVLPGESFIDEKTIDTVDRSISLRGRDLRGAILIRADLRKADFTGANLNGARFDWAKLSRARFGCASTKSRESSASIFDDVMSFEPTPSATDEGSWPFDGCTWLVGASFELTLLSGGWFYNARATGASFNFAQLSGATFNHAWLYGASFSVAQLQAASFIDARLEGVRLESALLPGAELAGASVWRADGNQMRIELTSKPSHFTHRLHYSPWKKSFQNWHAEVLALLPDETSRRRVDSRIAILDPAVPAPRGELTEKAWDELAKKPLVSSEYEQKLAEYLRRLACESEVAASVMPALVRNNRLLQLRNLVAEFARDFKNCAGAKALNESDRALMFLFFEATRLGEAEASQSQK